MCLKRAHTSTRVGNVIAEVVKKKTVLRNETFVGRIFALKGGIASRRLFFLLFFFSPSYFFFFFNIKRVSLNWFAKVWTNLFRQTFIYYIQKTYLLGKFSRLWCGFCLRWMFRLVQWHSILLATINGTNTRKIIENTWKLSIQVFDQNQFDLCQSDLVPLLWNWKESQESQESG